MHQPELGRGRRIKKLSRRALEALDHPLVPLLIPPISLPMPPELTPMLVQSEEFLRTEENFFGLSREYPSRPSFEPDGGATIKDMTDFHPRLKTNKDPPNILPPSLTNHVQVGASDWFSPFQNASTCRLLNWFWNGAEKKSLADLNLLVRDVLMADDFNHEDLKDFNAKREQDRIDKPGNLVSDLSQCTSSHFITGSLTQHPSCQPECSLPNAGWHEMTVSIPLPDGKPHAATHDTSPQFEIPGLHYRKLTDVIQAAFKSKDAIKYHYTPFKQFWRPSPELAEQRVYSELYSSNKWIQAHKELQEQPRTDDFERAIAGLMLWSDSTHLTNFGNASAWPVYLYFGNQSKYERGRPSAHACHHLAYIPSVSDFCAHRCYCSNFSQLPDSVVDAFKQVTGKSPTIDILAHCRCELMLKILSVIFDKEFVRQYKEGAVILCADGISRRIFPRIFTYSADYPEKCVEIKLYTLTKT